jgi:hypothetical protein
MAREYAIAVSPAADRRGGHPQGQGLRARSITPSSCVHDYPWGADHFLKTGVSMPDSALDEYRQHRAVYLGAIGDPRISTARRRALLLDHVNGPTSTVLLRRARCENCGGHRDAYRHRRRTQLGRPTRSRSQPISTQGCARAITTPSGRGAQAQGLLIDKASAVRPRDIWT